MHHWNDEITSRGANHAILTTPHTLTDTINTRNAEIDTQKRPPQPKNVTQTCGARSVDVHKAQVCLMAPTTAKVIAAEGCNLYAHTRENTWSVSARASIACAQGVGCGADGGARSFQLLREVQMPIEGRSEGKVVLTWARTLSRTSPHTAHIRACVGCST